MKRKADPDHKGMADKYTQILDIRPLHAEDIVRQTNVKGQFVLSLNDCIYVMYKKKKVTDTSSIPQTVKVPKNLKEPTATTITFSEPYAYFDFNGIIINPQSVIFDGLWSNSLIPQLLPVEHVP